MKIILSSRKHHYVAKVCIFLITVVLIAGMVSCDGGGVEYDLTMAVAPPGSGTATDLIDDSPYTAGTVVNIEAEPAAGYRFVSWTAPAGIFANPNAATTTFTMPAQDVTITANFVAVYTLTMAVAPAVAPPGSATATDLTNASPYAAGTIVIIEAVAAGYQFVNWTAPAGIFDNPNAATTTFTMPAQHVTVTAHFVGPLDHFTGYRVAEETAPYIGEVVYLKDQFGAVNATVEWAVVFSNPTQKLKLYQEQAWPISNPNHHLTLYNLHYKGEPHTWQVKVDNQFGTQNLTVSGPFWLAVPTQKEGHEPPVGLDHFLLYSVIGGLSVNVTVGLNDQFGNETVLVYQPVFFANPVQKTHDGKVTEIVNAKAHLVFYWIGGGYFGKEVQVVNQFREREQTLDVYGPNYLAVPSEKLYYEPYYKPCY